MVIRRNKRKRERNQWKQRRRNRRHRHYRRSLVVAVSAAIDPKNLLDSERLAQQINALLDSDQEVNMSWCADTQTAGLNGSTFQMTEDEYARVINSIAVSSQMTIYGDMKNSGEVDALVNRIQSSGVDSGGNSRVPSSVEVSFEDWSTTGIHFNTPEQFRDAMRDSHRWNF
jgi:hypothetical protein